MKKIYVSPETHHAKIGSEYCYLNLGVGIGSGNDEDDSDKAKRRGVIDEEDDDSFWH